MFQTVIDSCMLEDNALKIQVSDQIDQLDELINSEGDGQEFFMKTYITNGMLNLIVEGITRLSGQSKQAIFHLKQAMGGGKTHLLVGLGLLVKHPSLRKKVSSDFSIADNFGVAKIAAFNGRNNPPVFFWGEVAEQLNKTELFRNFWISGPKAPDERDWLKLFEGNESILVLLDEMPSYFHYLDTQKVGNGTVADIATRAFANMLTAAGKTGNVCIVVSDLAATYNAGTRLINKALNDARLELGRQEKNITPVDLEGNEVYDILRKRLFKTLPDKSVIEDIAVLYGRLLEEATKAKVANRGAEVIIDEIIQTYPFHPRLKNLIALFKENEKFKQTRGLLELVSRLLKSVWDRESNDVFLIGPQHFDLSIPEVREKLSEISGMRDVIAKDIWDVNSSAHAQIIDFNKGNDSAAQVGTLILMASLSTAINAVKGLTKEEVVEYLITPSRTPSDFLSALEALESSAWYLHHTLEGRYYFDRQENLTKLLQSFADDAPKTQVEELIKSRLNEMFRPIRKNVYSEVIPLPKISEIAEKVRKSRVLFIVSPDSKLPPEELQHLFKSLTQKNNICVLTGDKTQMGSVENKARQLFASQKAESRIPKDHPQREELERKQQQYEQEFTSTILNLFDKLLFPFQRSGKQPQLVNKPLDMTWDGTKSFNGEDQIEKSLINDPLKLYLDIDTNFDAIHDKAEILLWVKNQDEARWSDILDRLKEQSGMPWLPPKGIDHLKTIAFNRGLWEDMGNGYITKKPKKKKTSVQVIPETRADDKGFVRLRINPQNSGPMSKVYYSLDSQVSEQSTLIKDQILTTNALRVRFLVIDPSSQFETGDSVTWENNLILTNNLVEDGLKRKIELFVAPKGIIRYATDGSEPRNGLIYTGAFDISDDEQKIQVFAECDGIEAKAEFKFPGKGKNEFTIDDVKPAQLVYIRVGKKMDSLTKTFIAIKEAKDKKATFDNVTLMIGQGAKSVQIMIGELNVTGDYIESILKTVLYNFNSSVAVTMILRKANFASGYDLKNFANSLGIELQEGEVIQ